MKKRLEASPETERFCGANDLERFSVPRPYVTSLGFPLRLSRLPLHPRRA